MNTSETNREIEFLETIDTKVNAALQDAVDLLALIQDGRSPFEQALHMLLKIREIEMDVQELRGHVEERAHPASARVPCEASDDAAQ